ncbi:MAG: protein phosphatase 2C domain-containing protein [Bdellovibrionota bacterium]|jgi:serine/threonine protein phosphatase PrpC|nr:protein phosphatase 2C domain-containing protein [Bdellovibrionota bacterium]
MINLKSFAAKTDQGPYLQINEDGHEIDLNHHLYMIFDGFGGSSVGDKAVDLVNDTVKSFYTRIGGDPDSTLPFYFSPRYLIEGNALVNAMEYAHFLLKKENKDKDMNSRGGVSSIAVAQAENILTFASTGNCLGLFYSKGELRTVCEPDSFELISGDHFERHFTTAPASGFGLFDQLHLKIQEVRVNKGDKVILLTDGVYARVKESEIKDVLQREGANNQEKIEELFNLANGRGNLDNQTAVILNF